MRPLAVVSTTIAVLTLVVAGACTEPTPVSDAGNYPYRLSPRRVRIHGISRIAVLPARYADGAPAPIDRAAIATGYFGGAAGGGTNETFHLASGGTFTLRGEVAQWSTTTVKYGDVDAPGIVAATRGGDYIVEAIANADPDVNFGLFDNDGPDGFPNSGDDDGVVDGGVVLLNSDVNTTCEGTNGPGVHPHANNNWKNPAGQPFPTHDDRAGGGKIAVGGYIQMGALGCDGQPATNVLAHELGHLLFGLPDLYHIVGTSAESFEARRWVIGCWELMSAGSGWGCGRGSPARGTTVSTLGAWARTTVGWSVPIDRGNIDTVYTLRPPATGGDVLKLKVTDSEYFLVEYREAGPGDTMLPANGVLVYQVVTTRPLLPPVTGAREYRISLVEADDDNGLVRTDGEGGDRGAASDVFNVARPVFGSGHSRAISTAGAPLPFRLEITIDGANHRATVRVRPNP